MVLVMLGISNYGLYLMTGKSPFSDIGVPKVSVEDLNPLPAKPETAYKWVDEKGITHYSNEKPPQEPEKVEVMEVDPNVNLIQSVEVAEKKEEPGETIGVEGPLYKPETIQKLLNDAKDVERKLEERAKAQEEIINSL